MQILDNCRWHQMGVDQSICTRAGLLYGGAGTGGGRGQGGPMHLCRSEGQPWPRQAEPRQRCRWGQRQLCALACSELGRAREGGGKWKLFSPHREHREVMLPPSLEISKPLLHKALSNLIWSHVWPCLEQEVGLEISQDRFSSLLPLFYFVCCLLCKPLERFIT